MIWWRGRKMTIVILQKPKDIYLSISKSFPVFQVEQWEIQKSQLSSAVPTKVLLPQPQSNTSSLLLRLVEIIFLPDPRQDECLEQRSQSRWQSLSDPGGQLRSDWSDCGQQLQQRGRGAHVWCQQTQQLQHVSQPHPCWSGSWPWHQPWQLHLVWWSWLKLRPWTGEKVESLGNTSVKN